MAVGLIRDIRAQRESTGCVRWLHTTERYPLIPKQRGMNQDDLIREIQDRYRQAGPALNERQRRQWAAAEASRLGWGGISLVSRALRMSPNTIKRGIREATTGSSERLSEQATRIRKPGGGRRSKRVVAELSVSSASDEILKVNDSVDTASERHSQEQSASAE